MFQRRAKYLVIKLDDMDRYLSGDNRRRLFGLAGEIDRRRLQDGRKVNSYVVVNEDEPFATEVWWLIERHYEKKNRPEPHYNTNSPEDGNP